MRNQFFFTEKSPIPGKEGEFKELRSSFNIEKVIRSRELPDGRVFIILDDIHQRPQMVETKNKRGEVVSTKREMNTFQSEIYLVSKDDIERFHTWTSIDS